MMHFHRGDEIDVFYANADNYTIASNGTGCSGFKYGSPNTKRQKKQFTPNAPYENETTPNATEISRKCKRSIQLR